MELKVNVDGVERSISGVSNETTCAQIIYALAHATSQKGRFVMIEKFKKKERRLSPVDKPVELLEKFRGHRSNVSFVLKKVDEKGKCILPTVVCLHLFHQVFLYPTLKPSLWMDYYVNATSLPPLASSSGDRSRPPPPGKSSFVEIRFQCRLSLPSVAR
uniref:Ras-associating domain-containing protein n=1 Tax=Angiostrongylus cantonensis TaxID=6313 RepID=A0A0K0D8J9_ANGCA